jgi:hypothetical protein
MHVLPSPRGRLGPVVLSALALTLAAACAAGPAPTTTPPQPQPGPVQTTGAVPVPAAPQAPPAQDTRADDPADGLPDGFSACGQGPCEVRVDGPASIPLPAGAEVTEIRVDAVDADGVALVAVLPGRQVSTSCSGRCRGMRTTTSDGSSSVRLTAGTGARITVNRVAVEVRSVGAGSADLRVTLR